jgi:hypothetical protein
MWKWLEKLLYTEQKIQYANQTIYQANDPSTPDLRIQVDLPPNPTPLQITVEGFKGSVNNWGTPESDAATTYVTLATCLAYIQKMFGNPQKWAAVRVLSAVPRAGRQMNAYYDRRAVKYFYDQNPRTGRMVYLCESSDIVAHEMGHALLDAMRPDFWSVGALEIWSFHEAFADITALVTTAQFDQVIDIALAETANDLRKSNTLSMLAEEVGSALGMRDGLRNAANTFKYVDPGTLPANAPPNQLCAECHSFGRVFLGAWYEMMVGIYNQNKKTMKPKEALIKSLDTSYLLMLQAAAKAPRVAQFTTAVSKLMVSLAPKEYQEIIRQTFVSRNIITPQMMAMSAMKWDDFKGLVGFGETITASEENSRFITIPVSRTVKLAQNVAGEHLFSLSTNGYNLANVEIEAAADSYYEFDSEGNLISQLIPDEAEIVESTRQAVATITSIGPYEDTMWDIKKGKLVRTYID